ADHEPRRSVMLAPIVEHQLLAEPQPLEREPQVIAEPVRTVKTRNPVRLTQKTKRPRAGQTGTERAAVVRSEHPRSLNHENPPTPSRPPPAESDHPSPGSAAYGRPHHPAAPSCEPAHTES